MKLEVHETRVPLHTPFSIARGTQEHARILHLRLHHEGTDGWGEACPSPGVTGELFEECRQELENLDPGDLDLHDLDASLASAGSLGPAARSAIDLALHDLMGHLDERPVIDLLDLPGGMLPSAATVTLTDPERAREQAEGWLGRGYPRLKVKIGGRDGLALIDAVLEVLPTTVREEFPQPEVWVDANESLELESALDLLPALSERRVALLEQPLPRDDLDGLARLLEAEALPIYVDEAVQGPTDVARLAHLEGPLGINVKVQKVGGLQPARACIQEAQAQGREVMVGCNIETGLGIAAGAALTGAVDRADLDGNLFLEHDPFPLPRPMPGHVGTLEGSGLGVVPDPRWIL